MSFTSTPSFTFIDLFAGIGGFHLASHSLGMKCVFASEIDKYARMTYRANFESISPELFENEERLFNQDITKIDPKDIPNHDILCAGFPCQPFSISGKQKGFEDKRGNLFFEIAKIATHHQPSVLFLENVSNLTTHDNGNTLKTVQKILETIGYNTFYKVLNAGKFGLPTSRHRIYIVAFRKDLEIEDFIFPTATGTATKLIDILEPDGENTKSCKITRSDIFLKEKDVLCDIFGVYPQEPIRIGTINNGGQGERIYSPYGHSITLSAHGGGAGAKTGAYLIDGVVRKLTPRECARLMGFPDNYRILVSNSQAYKQFGNSVAVPVIKAIMYKIQQVLNSQNLCRKQKNTQEILAQKSLEMAL